MDSFKKLFDEKNMGQGVLAILFVIYLISGYDIPAPLDGMIDSMTGKIVVVILALLLFSYSNPILGVLGLLVAYMLITRASVTTGSFAEQNYLPTEKKKYTAMTAQNQFTYTLEQEIVKKMAPINKYESGTPSNYSFKPVLDNLHDAAPIDYNGVI